MRVLREGCTGDDVTRWQNFLVGQGSYWIEVTGTFDADTKEATSFFQDDRGLDDDGVAGTDTLAEAVKLGFIADDDQTSDQDEQGPNWPPAPSFAPLVSTADRQRVFGAFQYTATPVASNPEAITILGDWRTKNIVTVDIPQLRSIPGAGSGKVAFHRLGADKLQAMFQAWENAGLLPLVLTWGGSFVPRFVRGSKIYLSNHAFGTAFDLNVAWNGLGVRPALVGQHGSVRKLVPIANQHGFYWGGHYGNRPDGMHFELAVP